MKSRRLIGLVLLASAVVLSAIILALGHESQQSNLAQISMSEKSIQSPVALVNQGKAVLIDVRTDDEWNAGHAAHAVHFELAKLQGGELPSVPKDAAIYVYCRSGARATMAKTILE